jgi:hypothetical protein
MRPSEEMPLDPEVLAELEAIDATLAGDPVDPAHAELAELALLLAGAREQPSAEFARTLDARAARRFLGAPSSADARSGWGGRLRWPSRPVLGSALAGGLAVATAAVVISSGSLSSPASNNRVINGPAVAGSSHASTGVTRVQDFGSATFSPSVVTPPSAHSPSSAGSLSASTKAAGSPSAGVNLTAVPAPLSGASGSSGHVIQSAQLQLTASNSHIDAVAQEVFNVVALEGGTVESSQITAASNSSDGGSFATFSLRVPTGNLQAAMTHLSALRFASVASRTDGTQNVNGQYQADQRHIADQQALRAALLKQLQTADTQTAIDSIQAQLKLAEQQISADQATLSSLQRQISYSSLNVQINAGPIVVPLRATASSHGFTIGRAVHDSGRVLVVAAGVVLIGAAAFVPVALLVALGAWVTFVLRRRRRQQALDAA